MQSFQCYSLSFFYFQQVLNMVNNNSNVDGSAISASILVYVVVQVVG